MRKSNVRTTSNKARHTRYELDDMHIDQICWRPYRHFAREHATLLQLRLWSAQCPLIFQSYIEWCYPDRVTRQFGFRQDIPTRSPRQGHDVSHDYKTSAAYCDNWANIRENAITT